MLRQIKRKMTIKFVFILVLTSCVRLGIAQAPTESIPIGVIFEKNTEEIQFAFKHAILQSSIQNRTQVYVDVINTADAYKLSRLICNQYNRGVIGMLGSMSPASFGTLHSYTNTFQIPFINPRFNREENPPSTFADFAVSMRPDYHKAIVSTIDYYDWKTIIYLYDSSDGLMRMQKLMNGLDPRRPTFHVQHSQEINNATAAIDFLNTIERLNRWTHKYVVLDSTTKLAKEIIQMHVRDVNLGRRNVHYLLTGFVLDDYWDPKVTEYGAINITGFGLLDHSRKSVQDFFKATNKNYLSAQAALMYDSVQVLVDSIGRLEKHNPALIRAVMRRHLQSNNTDIIDCNPSTMVSMFKQGARLYRMLKKTEIEGLSGFISFNEAGQRMNFSLQVMEFTVDRKLKKMATWHDDTGMDPYDPLWKLKERLPKYDQRKKYIISTILESPFMAIVTDDVKVGLGNVTILKYAGFCVDLAAKIMDYLGLDYEFRLVRDDKFGAESTKDTGGWDGIVGELVRNEADMAIGSLAVSIDREKVIDFSRPFLTFNERRNDDISKYITLATFFQPLALEVWIGIGMSTIAVAATLNFVTHLSPQDLFIRVPGYSQVFINHFNFWNSFWFAVSTLFQQGYAVTPNSISARMVVVAWWMFTFIFISVYLANMSSFLTFIQMRATLWVFVRTANCPEDLIGEDINSTLCQMVVAIMPNGTREFAAAFPKGSTLRVGVNLALQDMLRNGDLQKIIRTWFATQDKILNIGDSFFALSLWDVRSIFYVLGLGMLSGLSSLCVELVRNKYRPPPPAEPPLPTELIEARVDRTTAMERTPRVTDLVRAPEFNEEEIQETTFYEA